MAISEDPVLDARAALRDGDADRAVALATEALGTRPDDPALLEVLTDAAIEAGHDDAVELCRRFVAAAPEAAAARRNLGLALLAEGDSAAAEEALRAAVRLDPEDDAAVVALGHLAGRAGDQRASAELLERAAAANPGDVGVLRSLVAVHRLAGRTRKAVEWAEALVAQAPDDPLALLDLAEGYLQVNEHDAARRTFARLRDADTEPGRAIVALHGMVEAELAAGRLRAALDLAVGATEVDRNRLTTDLLAHVVARVFGPGERPAPTEDAVLAALAAERAEYRRTLEQAVVV